MKFLSDKIISFPTVNSRDNGKLLAEENLSEIVTRITKLNFVYDCSYLDRLNSGEENPIGIYVHKETDPNTFDFDINHEFKCNINGYDVIISKNTSISIAYDNSGINPIPENYLYVKNENFENSSYQIYEDGSETISSYKIPIGFVLRRIANLNRLKGDKYIGDKYYYAGVELLCGIDLEDSAISDRDRLIVGWLVYDKDKILNKGIFNKNCIFIIDSKTISYNGESFLEYLIGNYVSKLGNKNLKDDHRSDVYSNLTFRDGKTEDSYRMNIGFSNELNVRSSNYIDIMPASAVKSDNPDLNLGISLESKEEILESSGIINHLRLGNSNIIDAIGHKITDSGYEEGWENLQIGTELVNDKEALYLTNTVVQIVPGNNSCYMDYDPDVSFNNNELEQVKYRFSDDKFSIKYNNDSIIEISCDKDVSRISFGDYETTPIFLDFDMENKNLSINDKLGSLGVVKFCDGQCVENNETFSDKSNKYYNYYSDEDKEQGLPKPSKYPALHYDYNDPNVPKEYSQTIETGIGSYMSATFNYLDDNSNFVITKVSTNAAKDSNISAIYLSDAYYLSKSVFTDNDGYFGFYVDKNGIMFPSSGAFDIHLDSEGHEVLSENSSYPYITVYNDELEEVKTYNYYCRRLLIDSSLYGNKLLIENLVENFDRFFNNDSIDNDKNFLDKDKINAYFCTNDVSYQGREMKFGYNSKYPNPNDEMESYKLVQTIDNNGNTIDIINHENLSDLNKIINVPTINSGNLYLIISCHVSSLLPNDGHMKIKTVNNEKVPTYFDLITPSSNHPGGYYNRGWYSWTGANISIHENPEIVIVDKSNIDTSNKLDGGYYYKLFEPIKIKQHFKSSIAGIISSSNKTIDNLDFRYTYTTSKSYKSFRIHGFYATYSKEVSSGSQAPVDDDSYKYQRLIYNVGFEYSGIVIEKIKVTIEKYPNVTELYKLSRQDGNNLLLSYSWIGYLQEMGQTVVGANTKYLYISDLNLKGNDKIFFASNENYSDNDKIDLFDNNPLYSEFYKETIQKDLGYVTDDRGTIDKYWFIKDLTITNTSGINFNYGQNKFNSNVDSYFNETLFASKIMFGEDDEFSTSISKNSARFIYEDDLNNYHAINLNSDGITFEKDLNDETDKNITLSKIKNDSFNGLSVSGDFKADRVFNAVYNDYADNLKSYETNELEPGDIICKDPNSDGYVKSNYDLTNLVVGVFSDTYGHLLGGDKNKSIDENSKNYVPVAVAGNVRVKVIGFVNPGDLITVSTIPGVGTKALSYVPGTIIGKALEYKDSYDVSRILIQVMLI